jgi:ribosomal protein S18 acetylase RimI-like enzyme
VTFSCRADPCPAAGRPSRNVQRPMHQPSAALVVRTARHSDIPAVLSIWEQARSAAAVTPDDDAAVEWLLERDPEALLLAEIGDTPVGVLIAAWDGWRGNMYRLAVEPAQRRRGIGLALVRAGERHLEAQGARRVTALVVHGDADAVSLWAAAGYARDETIARFVRSLG